MQSENVVSISYFENPSRFADLLNGYVYQGKEMVSAEEISEVNASVARIAGEGSAGKRRSVSAQVITADIVRKVGCGMRVALVALENQTDIHYAMPVRVMNAESVQYHKQWRESAKLHRSRKDLQGAEFLSGFAKKDKLIPIVTIVIYFGKEPWDGPVSLKEMMEPDKYPREIFEMVEDYHIHLLEVRKYTGTEVFHTDIRYVFGFLQREEKKRCWQRT